MLDEVGNLGKMRAAQAAVVLYSLPLSNLEHPLNLYLGKILRLKFLDEINCINCQRKTNKSFGQGYCYPCFMRLAACDSCIVSPEKCHYHLGTCREPLWGEEHCMIDHYVYLANSSGIKVGITRNTQVPTRWIDQGAVQAMPLLKVKQRFHSGLLEVAFKEHVADKTNYRRMLTSGEHMDLIEIKYKLLGEVKKTLSNFIEEHGVNSVEVITDDTVHEFNYPILEYPSKVVSKGLDKNPLVEGTLLGIKGQYLILDTGVINIRKHNGYKVQVTVRE